VRSLAASEKQAREKMMYFKRELENREESYNKHFSGKDGNEAVIAAPLRVSQSSNNAAKTKQEAKPARRKKKASTSSSKDQAGGTRKKRSAATSSTKLPKI